MASTPRLARLAAVALGAAASGAIALAGEARATVIHVPADYPTIQAAIDAASTGDTVLVAHGLYSGGLVIGGKTITLASHYVVTGDLADVSQTVITGGDPMLRIEASAVDSTVQGLTFQTGGQGLVNSAQRASILDNRFADTIDALSFETAGGLARGNVFDEAGDDAIDVDHPDFDLTIEGNLILHSGDDGIEIRLHGYTGPAVELVIRDNGIAASDEDGIQLIDYAGLTSRTILIEGNVIVGNAMAGLGCMANGNTLEDFAGAPMAEEVRVLQNTFSGNPHAITGGENMLVLDNIIAHSAQMGLDWAGAASLAASNDFWNNAADFAHSNVELATTRFADPLLAPSYKLLPGSPCIDAGEPSVLWNGTRVDAPPFVGPAPDLGARESPLPAPANVLTVGTGGLFADIGTALGAAHSPFTIVRVAPGNYPAFSIGATAPYGLRVTGDGTGPVTIDTTAQAVKITGLPASGAVELAGLTIGSASSANVGLIVNVCAGLVLLDDVVVHGGVGKPGLRVVASSRTVVQGAELDGLPGLRLDDGARVVASRGALDEFELAGSSQLTTCQLAASGTLNPGSTHVPLAGVMPDVTAPLFVTLQTPFAITLEGGPSQPAWLCVSVEYGPGPAAGPQLEMAPLADLAGGVLIPLGPLPGSGSLVLPAILPANDLLLGLPLVVQIITQDTSSHTWRAGQAATIVGWP